MNNYLEINNVFNPRYIKEHLDFWELCFGPKEKCNLQWYKWLNQDSPNGPNNSFTIKNSLGESLSSYGLLPISILYNQKQYSSSLCINGMTHPNHGKKGLFTEIISKSTSLLIKKEIQNFLSFPLGTNKGSIKAHLNSSFEELPDLFFYEKTQENLIPNLKHKYKIISSFTKQHNSGIKKFHKKYDFYFNKDYKILNWRYTNHPIYSYKIIELNEKEDFRGYAVVKLFQEKNVKKLHIVDYAYETLLDLDNLIKSIEDMAYRMQVNIINLWGFKHSIETQELISKGFTLSKEYNKFLLLSAKNFSNVNTSNWHIVLGDNDVF